VTDSQATLVAEAAKVNEAAEVSKARKLTTEFFRVNWVLEFNNLMTKYHFIFMF
jgi:hypothetical protein